MDILGFGDRTQTIDGPEMAVPLDEVELDIARNQVPEAFKQRNRDEWLELLHAADIAALPLNHPEDIFEDDQVRFAGVPIELPDDEHGTIQQIGPVIRFEKSKPATPRPRRRSVSTTPARPRSLDPMSGHPCRTSLLRWRGRWRV